MKKMIQILALALFLPMALTASEEKGMSVKERRALLQQNQQKPTQSKKPRRGRRENKKGRDRTAQLAQNLTNKGLAAAIIAGRVRAASTEKAKASENRGSTVASITSRPQQLKKRRPKTRKKFVFSNQARQPAPQRRNNATADFSGQLADTKQRSVVEYGPDNFDGIDLDNLDFVETASRENNSNNDFTSGIYEQIKDIQ